MLKTTGHEYALVHSACELSVQSFGTDPLTAKLEGILRSSNGCGFVLHDPADPGYELRVQVRGSFEERSNTSTYHLIVDDGRSIQESRLLIDPRSPFPAQRCIGASLQYLFPHHSIEHLDLALEGDRFDVPSPDPVHSFKDGRPSSPSLQSALIEQKNQDVASTLIERIFNGLPEDIAGAKGTLDAFVCGKGTLEKVSPIERGLRFLEYRIFYDEKSSTVGIGGLYQVPRFGESTFFLGWLGIAPEFRKQGYGRALVRSLERLAMEKGAEVLMVHTPHEIEEFKAARSLYSSEGYAIAPAYFHRDSIYTEGEDRVPLESFLVKDLRRWSDDLGRRLVLSLGWHRDDAVQLQATWPQPNSRAELHEGDADLHADSKIVLKRAKTD